MPAGIPRTELERRERHQSLYGREPPDNRFGRGDWAETWEMPDDELSISDETLVAPAAVYAYAIAHPYVAAGAVAAITGIVHAIDVAYEKRRRKKAGLPVQPQLAVTAIRDQRTGVITFKFTITGTYPGRQVMLKIGKGKWYGLRDMVIANRYGSGTIELSDTHLLEEARRKKIIDIGMPQVVAGTKELWIYVQESRSRMGDIRSPITLVKVEVKGVVGKTGEAIREMKEEAARTLLGFKILTTDEAKELIKAGKPCFIKSVLPIISMLPGLPYTPGMWVPWLCVITDIQ